VAAEFKEEEDEIDRVERKKQLSASSGRIDSLLLLLFQRFRSKEDENIGRKELLVLFDVIETRNLEMIESPSTLVEQVLTLMSGCVDNDNSAARGLQSRCDTAAFVNFFRTIICSRNPKRDYPQDIVSLRYSILKLSEKMQETTGIHGDILPHCIYPLRLPIDDAAGSSKRNHLLECASEGVEPSFGMCTICRAKLATTTGEGPSWMCLPCGGGHHMFHERCIVEWLDERQECPLCRRNVMLSQLEVAREAGSLGLFSLRKSEEGGNEGLIGSLVSCSIC
jgi:hypothetical protein